MQAEVLSVPAAERITDNKRSARRLPFVVYALAACTFLMLTTEFVVAGLLPDIATQLQVSVARAGLLITVFALGMIVGAPTVALLTRRLPRRLVLVSSLVVFAIGHVVVAIGSSFPLLLGARFLTAWATGAFWSVAFVVAGRAAGPAARSRAMGVVTAGGMLANVVGVPLGALAGQLVGWRGPFWALAVLGLAGVGLIVRAMPADAADEQQVPIRSELAALRSGRLWLALLACATTTGGVLSAYSYISPLLTDRTGLTAGLVPPVLVAFGVGNLLGTVAGGRLGDHRPHLTTIAVPATATIVLAALVPLSTQAVPTVVLVAVLGLVGLSANPVLIAFAVRFADAAPTLGSSLSVAAFNVGTAAGSSIAGLTLSSSLHAAGPLVVGAVSVVLTLIPTGALALLSQRGRIAATVAERAFGVAPCAEAA